MDRFTRNLLMISYLAIAFLVWLIIGSSMEYLFNYWHILERYRWTGPVVRIAPIVLGILASFIAYKVKRFREYLFEVVSEVKKVTWPAKKETWAATIVVIIAVLIAGFVLGLFDWISSYVLKLILG